MKKNSPTLDIYKNSKDITLQIKEEQIDIAKRLIQTGEVKVYRETFMDEKVFTVPVLREELVIEKRVLNSDNKDDKGVSPETIRIPLSQEQVEFTKHRVILEDVSIYKQQIEDIIHIEEKLKMEKAHVKISESLKSENYYNQF